VEHIMTAVLDAAIDAGGVRELRRAIYSKPSVVRDDLVNLLNLGRRPGAEASAEYVDLLVDVATDLLVNQADPPMYVAPADADWLAGQLKVDGDLNCHAEFAMLRAVLSRAVSVPPTLASFAVGEIERAVVEGHNAARGAAHAKGKVTREDVEALRTAVFAATQGSSLHVTRESAEALFRIAHATSGADNDQSFNELFAQAVGNYLMGIAFHWTPDVADEIERERWLEQPAPSLGGFLGGLLRAGKQDQPLSESERVRREDDADRAEIAARSDINSTDGDWVLAHLTRGADITAAEKSLLAFLRDNAHSLPAALAQTIQALAR
jgi:hypothetical protein